MIPEDFWLKERWFKLHEFIVILGYNNIINNKTFNLCLLLYVRLKLNPGSFSPIL